MEIIEFLPENDILRRFGAVKEVDVALATLIGQVAQYGHKRRDAHASGNEHDAVGLRAAEGETAGGSGNVEQVAFAQGVMKVARGEAVVLALDADFAVVGPGRGRSDGVGAVDPFPVDLQRKNKVLAGQMLERETVGAG